MHKKIYLTAAIFAVLAVGLGAFGAHSLKSQLSPKDLDVFQTGVQYHFYHVFALIIAGLFYKSYKHHYFSYAATCFGLGIIFFSFSLYLLVTLPLTAIGDEKWLAYLTPLGGLLFIIGWLFVAAYFAKDREKIYRKTTKQNEE